MRTHSGLSFRIKLVLCAALVTGVSSLAWAAVNCPVCITCSCLWGINDTYCECASGPPEGCADLGVAVFHCCELNTPCESDIYKNWNWIVSTHRYSCTWPTPIQCLGREEAEWETELTCCGGLQN